MKYEVKEVPNIKISLIDHEKIIHTIIIDKAKHYEKLFDSKGENQIRIYTSKVNLKDYQILISKKYDKYLIETSNYWYNIDTKENELIEEPVVLCNNCEIFYAVGYTDEPSLFEIRFSYGKE